MKEPRSRPAQRWRDTEERFQLLVDCVKDYAIFALDADGRITSWNAGVARLLGYAEEEFVGRPFSLVFLPEDVAGGAVEKELSETVAAGRREEDRWHLRKNGARFWASGVLAAQRDDRGHLRGFINIMRDNTARKLAEEERATLLIREQRARQEAQAASQLRDEFLTTLSHELRAPLNAIAGWVTLLRILPAGDARRQHGLDVIARSVQRQTALINDLLDYRGLTTGDITLMAAPVDLHRIVDRVVDPMRPEAAARSIALDVSERAEGVQVMGDAERLAEVVMKLLSNALTFTPPGGSVAIALEVIDHVVVLTVTDTGAGLDRAVLPHIFDPFRQVDGSTRRAHGGVGLGLATVRELVARHGGTVAADSDGEGRGSVFTVRLPIFSGDTDTSRPAPVDASLSVSLSGLRVLIIDDDADAREIAVATLERAGATTRAASSVTAALQVLTDGLPDAIVCDIAMPHQDGFDFIRQLRALPPDQGGRIPAIALTALNRAEDRLRCLTAGFQVHVAKPFDSSAVIAAIASICGRPASA